MSDGWSSYQSQVPEWRSGAKPSSEEYYDVGFFDYADVQYTNWQKIPILMPAAHAVLRRIMGEERADLVSIRTMVFDTNRVYWMLSVVFYVLLVVAAAAHVQLRRRQADL